MTQKTDVHVKGCTLAGVSLVLLNCDFNTRQTTCPASLPHSSQYCSNRNANSVKGKS